MQDGFGRTIQYLRLSVTDECNYGCCYCTADGSHSRRNALSFAQYAEIVEAAAACGIRKVRLTGGEPLLRQALPALCMMLKEIPGIEELAITTNGSLLAGCAAKLRSAGVDRLNVSLDTLNAEKFRAITRTGNLADVLQGIDAAGAAGFQQIKLNTVLLGGFNEDEIADFAALTEDAPLSVRFIELMPMDACAGWPRERYLSAERVLETLPDLVPVGTDGVAELFRLPGHQGTVGLIRPMSHQFCGSCDRIRVTAGGMLKPCLHSPEEIPLGGLHGAALEQAFRQAISQKPASHRLLQDHRTGAVRSMREIGG